MRLIKYKKLWLFIFAELMLIGLVFLAYKTVHAATSSNLTVQQVLKEDAGLGGGLKSIWRTLMNTVNGMAIVALIMVAFVEILHLQVDTYKFKKFLPTLLLAVVAANFSWLIVRLFVDWNNVLLTIFGSHKFGNPTMSDTLGNTSLTSPVAPLNAFKQTITIAPSSSNTSTDIFNPSVTTSLNFLQAIILVLFVWIAAIAQYILAFLFFIRNWILYALAATSGVAFMLMSWPWSKSLFNQWWTQFIRWVFMPLGSIALLWVASLVISYIGGVSPLMGFVFAVALIYGAIQIPLKSGGVIMSSWAKLGRKPFDAAGDAGKKAGSWAWKKARAKWIDPRIKYAKDKIMSAYLNNSETEGGFRKGGIKGALGYMARRSRRTKREWDEAARQVTGKEETADRAAFGGKFGQFEKEMKPHHRMKVDAIEVNKAIQDEAEKALGQKATDEEIRRRLNKAAGAEITDEERKAVRNEIATEEFARLSGRTVDASEVTEALMDSIREDLANEGIINDEDIRKHLTLRPETEIDPRERKRAIKEITDEMISEGLITEADLNQRSDAALKRRMGIRDDAEFTDEDRKKGRKQIEQALLTKKITAVDKQAVIKQLSDQVLKLKIGKIATAPLTDKERADAQKAIARDLLKQKKLDIDVSAQIKIAKNFTDDQIRQKLGLAPDAEVTKELRQKAVDVVRDQTERKKGQAALDTWAQYIDDINGDFGERDWINKKLLNDWFERTAAGQAAVDRSTQYAFRVAAEESRGKFMKQESEMLALHHVPGVANRYHDQEGFSHETRPYHFAEMQQLKQEWDGRLLVQDMMRQKTEGDALTADTQNAFLLDRVATDYHATKKFLDDLGHTLTEAQKASGEKTLELYRKNYEEMLKNSTIKGSVNGQGILQGNLPTVKAIACDANGKVDYDINNAHLLKDVWHIPEANAYMFEGREAKRYTARAKEEFSSEQGKRTDIMSGDKVFNYWERNPEEVHTILNGDLSNLPPGHPAEVLIAQLRNFSTAFANSSSDNFRRGNLDYLIPMLAGAATEANGQMTRNVMKESIKNGIELVLTNSSFIQQTNTSFITSLTKALKAQREAAGESPEAVERAEADLKKMTARQLNEQAELLGHQSLVQVYSDKLHSDLGLDIKALEDYDGKIDFDHHTGQVSFELNTEAHAIDETERKQMIDDMKDAMRSLASVAGRDRQKGAAASGYAAGLLRALQVIKIEPGVHLIENAIDGCGGRKDEAKIVAMARSYSGLEGSD